MIGAPPARRFVGILLLAFALGVSPSVRARATSTGQAAARAHFARGKQLFIQFRAVSASRFWIFP